MNEQTQIEASMWLMIVIRTIGSMDLPGHGPRKMPSPRTYVAIIVLWSIFGLLVDSGQRKAAVTMAWVTVAVSLVVGPFGGTLSNLLKTIGTTFGTGNDTGQVA